MIRVEVCGLGLRDDLVLDIDHLISAYVLFYMVNLDLLCSLCPRFYS